MVSFRNHYQSENLNKFVESPILKQLILNSKDSLGKIQSTVTDLTVI